MLTLSIRVNHTVDNIYTTEAFLDDDDDDDENDDD
jgi:hypothetical protein